MSSLPTEVELQPIARAHWTRVSNDDYSDLHDLRISLAPLGKATPRVLHFVANARSSAWDVQDAHGYVYAHGKGVSVADCKLQAESALQGVLDALRMQLGASHG